MKYVDPVNQMPKYKMCDNWVNGRFIFTSTVPSGCDRYDTIGLLKLDTFIMLRISVFKNRTKL